MLFEIFLLFLCVDVVLLHLSGFIFVLSDINASVSTCVTAITTVTIWKYNHFSLSAELYQFQHHITWNKKSEKKNMNKNTIKYSEETISDNIHEMEMWIAQKECLLIYRNEKCKNMLWAWRQRISYGQYDFCGPFPLFALNFFENLISDCDIASPMQFVQFLESLLPPKAKAKWWPQKYSGLWLWTSANQTHDWT